MKKNKALLIIDPQNDFCDPEGSLYVPGADQDMARLADYIKNNKENINNIYVTLDSHFKMHVAHPIFWKDASGNHPNPFDVITVEDVMSGKWMAADDNYQQRALQYVQQLKEEGRYELRIWPYHCVVDTWGHKVYRKLRDALDAWEYYHKTKKEPQLKLVDYFCKGSNLFTEQYSAVKAAVPDVNDRNTILNERLIDSLHLHTEILVAGEASSHCVLNTVKDILDSFNLPGELVLIRNCMSPVPGFETTAMSFFKEMENNGIKLINV